jgi:hypothetical protein
MPPATIAKTLELPVQKVYAHLELAGKQVANFVRKQERKYEQKKQKGRGASQ